MEQLSVHDLVLVAVEISDDNFRWLVEAVQVGDYTAVTLPRSQSRAKLGESLLKTCKDVRWREQRKTLWTTYRQKGKMRTLSKRVSSCSDESRAERKITQEAARLQSLRDSMHEQSTKKRKSRADAHSTPSNAASSGHATSDFSKNLSLSLLSASNSNACNGNARKSNACNGNAFTRQR